MIKLTDKDGGVMFAVRVQPRASRSGVVGELDGALKIRLAAPPVDGEANEELIRVLAKLFDVPRAQIAIASGQTSKNKLIRIAGMSADKAGEILQSTLGV
ncbi:MAG: YggU family protein [Acidobacteria bacterium]|nr:YggU family protein [Acidobacteriota bacterium]